MEMIIDCRLEGELLLKKPPSIEELVGPDPYEAIRRLNQVAL
jgi:hypothetical protein